MREARAHAMDRLDAHADAGAGFDQSVGEWRIAGSDHGDHLAEGRHQRRARTRANRRPVIQRREQLVTAETRCCPGGEQNAYDAHGTSSDTRSITP